MGTPKTQLRVQPWDNGQQAEPRVCAMMRRHQDPRRRALGIAMAWEHHRTVPMATHTGCDPQRWEFWGGQLFYPSPKSLVGFIPTQGTAAALQNYLGGGRELPACAVPRCRSQAVFLSRVQAVPWGCSRILSSWKNASVQRGM